MRISIEQMNQEKSTPLIEIYTTDNCPYCRQAKLLFNKKRVRFKEIDVQFDLENRKEMHQRTGKTSVPQIFINGKYIPGVNFLFALQDSGKLDEVLYNTTKIEDETSN